MHKRKVGRYCSFFFKANEKEEVGSDKTQTGRSGGDLRLGMSKMRGCRGRGMSIVSPGASGTNSCCEWCGLTKVTNYETQDLNVAGNIRVQQRFVIVKEQKMGK